MGGSAGEVQKVLVFLLQCACSPPGSATRGYAVHLVVQSLEPSRVCHHHHDFEGVLHADHLA